MIASPRRCDNVASDRPRVANKRLIAMMDPMRTLPPIRFRPILREYLWGGRRLGSELGKPIGDGDHYAESWEIVDHGQDQSVVINGPLAGKTLHELVVECGPSLFGRHHSRPLFPLLFKYLDAHQTLSVQVHPNDAQAASLDPPDLGKTEAWVVLAAEPGSKIYAGLRPGVDRLQLEQAVREGRCEDCLHTFKPAAGDCVFIEAGTVHALGAGLLIAEIQQASDTTFRLYDWNRVDRDGKPRPLHIRQSLETIDFDRGPVGPRKPQPTGRPGVERLVACDKFVLERWRLDQSAPLTVDQRFHIVSVIEGRLDVSAQESRHELKRGDTILLPASSADVELSPRGEAVFVDMYLP
jgi:mannose-6-phosphate isomerase